MLGWGEYCGKGGATNINPSQRPLYLPKKSGKMQVCMIDLEWKILDMINFMLLLIHDCSKTSSNQWFNSLGYLGLSFELTHFEEPPTM